ncbi:MAG: DUF1236 domain-containing protein [Aurantimonas endophytica]|jgi:hypothetical protein|uniref:DUF1236 domain-containing protein n=1 Tax=Aurantimonas endophytica TaxID=1522175 RepID=A0A7W6HAK0_9HYPH|nr:DUF1236 domain-containing protein [Aurantimonas endophytica]MBB4001537.1 hypothetical protein [Aurantimonas endophytica]MCO6402823.1 DUF1236 domain-containing protein [Aurantimonas endophytica]
MKSLLIAAGLALLAGSATAQTTTTVTTTTIEEPQIDSIRTYVTREQTTSIVAPDGFDVIVGAPLPEPVPLYRLPEEVGVPAYQYTVIDGHTVLVDENRNIVQIID